MAPTNPETWTHGPSIIKENELREMAMLLGKGFRVHHPDAVGGISLSCNPNPQRYMVMHYHSVENGFRLPLHGLLRDLCLHFGFAPGQLTANAHKYVASYILRCCALDKTPKLDEFLLLFSIGGFPFYSLYPHNHFPIFEKVEFKYEKWSLRYFVIEFPAHSPLDLPGVVLRRSISRTKFAAAESAEGVYNALREKEGLISHHSLQDVQLYKKAGFYYPLGPDPFPFEGVPSPERSKAPSAAESNPAASSFRDQFQGNSTALVICKPAVALDVTPISAIPRLRRPTPSQKRPREGVTDDDFLPKKNRGDGQTSLRKPKVQPQSDANNPLPQTASAPQELEEEVEEQEEPESSPAVEKEVEVQTETEIPSPKENEVGMKRDAEAPLEMARETETQPEPEGQCSTATLQAPNIPIRQRMRESVQEPAIPQARPDLLALNALHLMEQAQQSLLTLTEEYLGGASRNYRAIVLLKEREMAARALQQRVDSLEQQVQVLQAENARLKVDGSMELAVERSKVQSLQEQVASYQKGTQDLEVQFDRFQAQISILESRASASEDQVGSLKAELVERESRIFELGNSLQEAKYEGSRLNELALKHMEARRLTLEKLKEERQAASELRLKTGELEKTIAAHQEEVITLTARVEALYEEGKFDMQQCIYEAVQSGLPEN
ncbi:unnamed protein product [Cuscuta campestris]|uniref:Uncharacterized protein n=1 Tax=Cuscuta campestris TaxID=132261 RepID=A0A484LTL1_9ASTE|nr:unnamed protein product [Cuscuta campestris]